MAKGVEKSVGEGLTVFNMDLVAFIDAEYRIRPDRNGSIAALPNSGKKKAAFWVYDCVADVENAIAVWDASRGVVEHAFAVTRLNLEESLAVLPKESTTAHNFRGIVDFMRQIGKDTIGVADKAAVMRQYREKQLFYRSEKSTLERAA